jgi:hypothetical protein
MALAPDPLTEAMMQALHDEWQAAKGSPLPDAGAEDRRLLFAAVAKGLLGYLKANEDGAVRSIELRAEGPQAIVYTVVSLDLGVEGA